MRRLFERHRPSVVFHAAAYKHVPLMEANPLESVPNNVFGTQVLAELAAEHGVEALRARLHRQGRQPEERHGPDEALCEWIVEAAAAPRAATARSSSPSASATCSAPSGSVIPLFRQQIARGGPGHRHAPGHEALLHDDPRGGAARPPGGRDRRRAATSSCSTWASR